MKKELLMPIFSTCKICRNYLSDLCQPCLTEENQTRFHARSGLSFEDLPPFPSLDFHNGMPVKMRQVVMAFYMERIVERLRGIL